jgi:hypothetical protein
VYDNIFGTGKKKSRGGEFKCFKSGRSKKFYKEFENLENCEMSKNER